MQTNALMLMVAALSCLSTVVACASVDTSLCPPGRPRKVTPLFDHPLRDISVCRGPEGAYYLTGTSATRRADGSLDFQSNDGVWLWKSEDLEDWQEVGQVWSITEDPLKSGIRLFDNPSKWQLSWRAGRNPCADSPVRGMTSPEVHFVRDNFYITYSMNGEGTGLLASKTGRAEGPYEEMGRMTISGGEASLFEDDDGAVYWVWGDGWIARMKDDLSGPAETPRQLSIEPETEHADYPLRIGSGGAFIFKADVPGWDHGDYHLVGYEDVSRMGPVPCRDTFIASAESVYGPYKRRDLLIPHGGQSTVFKGPQDRYYATFSGSDEWAAVRDRPAVVPLAPHASEWGADYWWCGAFVKPWYPVTEAGAWSEIDPFVKDVNLRDVSVLNAPDGYYYVTGTDMDLSKKRTRPPRDQIGVQVWRSRDMENWEDMGLIWKCDDSPESRAGLSNYLDLEMNTPILYDIELHHAKGTFWIVGSMQIDRNWWAPGGCLILMLRSTSGNIEGPYEFMWKDRHDSDFWTPSILEDDDGSVYIVGGGRGNTVARLKDDLSGPASEKWQVWPKDLHAVGEGGHLIKIGDKYVHTSAVWHGMVTFGPDRPRASYPRFRLFSTYDLMYFTADDLKGPWSETRCAAPKCGNSRPFKDKQGNWHAPFFGNHYLGPWSAKPGAYPLEVRQENGDVFIEPVE